MAVDKQATKKRQIKKSETVRERAEKATTPKKVRRIRRAGNQAARPIRTIARIGRKEYYLPIPDNKYGRFLNKKRKITPNYFRASFQELKLVQWPNNKETLKLTLAVFIFSLFFGTIITLADYGLDKVFKSLILK